MSDFASRVAGEVATNRDEQSRFAAQVAGESASRKSTGLKTLRGGATGRRFHLGPCMAVEAGSQLYGAPEGQPGENQG